MSLSRRTVLAVVGASAAPAFAANDGPSLPPRLSRLVSTPLTLSDATPTTLGAHTPSDRPSVISFWATWCAPCVTEARHLARTRTRHGIDRLNIIGINVDRDRDEAAIAGFLEHTGVNYTQLRGDLAAYQSFGGGEQILLPRLFVFDRIGQPTAAFGRYAQFVTLGRIDRAIEAVVGG
jgi:cytochrome c biogenesis protein CcmG/thiol:disulfide interchange protein DsbE